MNQTRTQDHQEIFGKSWWIWPGNIHWDIHNSYALFRKTFDLAEVPSSVPFRITADQSYRLYVNGNYVCAGPARGFQKSWPFDEVEIAPLLCPGRNVLAVRAHNPGFSNFQYLTEGYAGLLAAGRAGSVFLGTDTSWKCRRQTGVNPAATPVSLQLFCQEHIDLRVEDPAWMEPDFDDSGWTEKTATTHWNSMPWNHLEERGIPLLREETVLPRAVLGLRDGRSVADSAQLRNVSLGINVEGLSHEPLAGEDVIAFADAGDFVLPPSGQGRFRRVLIDFGHTVVGSLSLYLSDARGGETIDTLHGETIDPGTLSLDFTPEAHSRMAFSHRLVCRPGVNTHTFHHPFGFRYMILVVRDSETPFRVRASLVSKLYPLDVAGRFNSSDPLLNGIWNACVRTQQCCSMDAYVDTPWREQAQWWGDARVQAWNTFHLSGDVRLLRRGIGQIASQMTPNGLTYGHAPTMAHNCILPDFSLIWILTLWDYYWQTGSLEPFEAHQETIDRIVAFFEEATDPASGLVRHDPRYWLFLDWTDIHREGCPTLLNFWFLTALEKIAAMHVIRGDAALAAARTSRAAALRAALARLVGADGLIRDGLDEKGRVVAESSIHSQTLALLSGLRETSPHAIIDNVLLPFLREEKAFKSAPSAYWITYVFTALHERGHGDDVLRYIAKHWAAMGDYGTTWENFAPRRGDESFSHAWSAHPLYHLEQILGGIVQTASGWKAVRFAPLFFGASCEIRIPTPLGILEARWIREAVGISVELRLPPGIEAEVRLPGLPAGTARGTSRWTIALPREARKDAASARTAAPHS
ncbi:alpha-L-rhamnosidase [Verrucomicrobium sp. GAS474]|uniref:alpha-L-rhamnosidase-related protein n=1 Tax=Verrucomicrobium sp. GAS474 TaxID=1882831 RepID=UPI00087D862A|nr:alpha-L-rhamnosidase C-terminal domain-containing protein [Verrucomicrobium sp. GAS474]SDU02729.1 alpha-L-rhamnosidase [Verrucomicrobium sp. GAS474]